MFNYKIIEINISTQTKQYKDLKFMHGYLYKIIYKMNC